MIKCDQTAILYKTIQSIKLLVGSRYGKNKNKIRFKEKRFSSKYQLNSVKHRLQCVHFFFVTQLSTSKVSGIDQVFIDQQWVPTLQLAGRPDERSGAAGRPATGQISLGCSHDGVQLAAHLAATYRSVWGRGECSFVWFVLV